MRESNLARLNSLLEMQAANPSSASAGMGWILQLRSPRPNHFGWTAVVENGAVLIRDENQFSARLSTGRPPIALA